MEILVKNDLPDLIDSNIVITTAIGDTTITIPNVSGIPDNCIITIASGVSVPNFQDAEVVEIERSNLGVFNVIQSYYHGNYDTKIQHIWASGTTIYLFFNQMYYDCLKDAINSLISDAHSVEEAWTFKKGLVVAGESSEDDGAIRYKNNKLQARQNGRWSDLIAVGIPNSLYLNGTVYYDPITQWTSNDQLRIKPNPTISNPPTLDPHGEVSVKSQVSLWEGTGRFQVRVSDAVATVSSNKEIQFDVETTSFVGQVNADILDANIIRSSLYSSKTNLMEFDTDDSNTVYGEDGEQFVAFFKNAIPSTKRKCVAIHGGTDDPTIVLMGNSGFVIAKGLVITTLNVDNSKAITITEDNQININGESTINADSLVSFNGDIEFTVTSDFKIKLAETQLMHVDIDANAPVVFDEAISTDRFIQSAEHISLGESLDQNPQVTGGILQWTAANGFRGWHQGKWVNFQTAESDLPISSPGYTLRWNDHHWVGTDLVQVHDDQMQIHLPIYADNAIVIGDKAESESDHLGMVRYNGDFQGYMQLLNPEGILAPYWVSLTGGGLASGAENGEMLVFSTVADKWISAGQTLIFEEGQMYMNARLRGLVSLAVPETQQLPQDFNSGETQCWKMPSTISTEIDGEGVPLMVPGPAPDGARWLQYYSAPGVTDVVRMWGKTGTRSVTIPGITEDDPSTTETIDTYGWINFSIPTHVNDQMFPNPSGHSGELLTVRSNVYAWTHPFVITENSKIEVCWEAQFDEKVTINKGLKVTENINVNDQIRLNVVDSKYIGIGAYDENRSGNYPGTQIPKKKDDLLWQLHRIDSNRPDSYTDGVDEDTIVEKDFCIRYGLNAEPALTVSRDNDAYIGRDVHVGRSLFTHGPITLGSCPTNEQVLGMIAWNGDFEGYTGDHWVSLTNRLATPRIPVPIVEAGSIITIGGNQHVVSSKYSSTALTLTTTLSVVKGAVVSFANGAIARIAISTDTLDVITLDRPVTFLPDVTTIDTEEYTFSDLDGNTVVVNHTPIWVQGTKLTLSDGNQIQLKEDYNESLDPVNLKFQYVEVQGTTLRYQDGWTFTDEVKTSNHNTKFDETIELGPCVSNTPIEGMIKYDGDFFGYNGQSWVSLSGNGDQTITVTTDGTMLVSNGTIWIGTDGVQYLNNTLKVHNLIQLDEYTDDPTQPLVRGMIRHRGDLEYYTGSQWISLTDYYGIQGGHLPNGSVSGAVLVYDAVNKIWDNNTNILITNTFHSNLPGVFTQGLKLGQATTEAGSLKYDSDTDSLLGFVEEGWQSLTAKFPIPIAAIGSTLYSDGSQWATSNHFRVVDDGEHVSVVADGSIECNALNIGAWTISDDGGTLTFNTITLTDTLVSLPGVQCTDALINGSATILGNLVSGDARLGNTIVNQLVVNGTTEFADLIANGPSTLANVELATLTTTEPASFANTIKIGDQDSESAEGGMLRFHSSDFEGFDGSNWLSLTGGSNSASSVSKYLPASEGTRKNTDYHGSNAEVFVEGENSVYRAFMYPDTDANSVFFQLASVATTVTLNIFLRLLDSTQAKQVKFLAKVSGGVEGYGDPVAETVSTADQLTFITITVTVASPGSLITIQIYRDNSVSDNYVGSVALIGVEVV